MYDTLKRLYDTGRATAAGLQRATTNGWITPEEFTEITGQAYTPPEVNKYGLTPEQDAAYQQEVVDSIVKGAKNAADNQ